MNHERLFQAVATKDRFADAADGLRADGRVGEKPGHSGPTVGSRTGITAHPNVNGWSGQLDTFISVFPDRPRAMAF